MNFYIHHPAHKTNCQINFLIIDVIVDLLEPIEKKRMMGKKLGADICIDPLHENIKEGLQEAGLPGFVQSLNVQGFPQLWNRQLIWQEIKER